MLDTNFVLFLAASLVLIITPGQDMILVMSRSIAQGSKAGVATAAGVSVGLLGHTVLATFGLGAILRTSEILFFVIKIIGAAYLLYLGIKLLRTRHEEILLNNVAVTSLRTLFFQGAFSNLSNPKIAIFYFAFLPQFIPTGTANPTLMLLILGATFALLTFFIKAPIGYGAGSFSKWLRSRPFVQIWINRISGGVLIALGIRLAFEKRA
jgi:threonine/homoserine/homoserine lactone efflux protein